MQTFLPYKSFIMCAEILDNKRLVKQILECGQILGALNSTAYEIIFMKPKRGNGWSNHPAVRMWRGFESTLVEYMNEMLIQYTLRYGRVHTFHGAIPMLKILFGDIRTPDWFHDEEVFQSHRAQLFMKDPNHYHHFANEKYREYKWPV